MISEDRAVAALQDLDGIGGRWDTDTPYCDYYHPQGIAEKRPETWTKTY